MSKNVERINGARFVLVSFPAPSLQALLYDGDFMLWLGDGRNGNGLDRNAI